MKGIELMQQTTAGLLILIVAGLINASFTLPMKFTRKWAWENTWLAWTVYALWILPVAVTLVFVPQTVAVYSHVSGGVIVKVAIFGAGWGVAQVFFRLAVDAIGIALAFSIILGLSAALGSLLPLVQLHVQRTLSAAGIGLLVLGLVLVSLGVSVLAVAGRRRERATGVQADAPHRPFGRGLFFAIAAGVLAAFMNIAFTFGAPIVRAASGAGILPVWQTMPAWLLIMLGGSVANLLFCIHLLRRNRTGNRFRETGTRSYWLLAAIMAVFWFASTLMYGVASGKLGALGPVLGWPLFMSLIVITASVLGLITGEWKTAGSGPVRIMLGGVGFLVFAVFVLAMASRYL